MATRTDAGQAALTDLARAVEQAEGPLARLHLLSQLMERVEAERRAAAAQARQAGASWSRVAEQLGTTRQAAQQRYGSKRAEADESRRESVATARPIQAASNVGDWELTTRSGRVLLVLRRIRRRPGRR